MSRQETPTCAASRLPAGSKGIIVTALAGVVLTATAEPARAAWGVPCLLPQVRAAPPDQSWLKDVPETPGVRSGGRVAVFAFKDDDVFEPVRAAAVRALRKRGLNVTATLRPADSPAQYRAMSISSNLAVFVDGEVSGQGSSQTVQIRLRSGVTGQYFTSARFSGPMREIVGSIERTLWTRVGSAIIRTCTSAARPRRPEAEPLYIEAGTPLEGTSFGL